ncbi:MAG: hypothetical protein ACM3KR_11110 [Deltaproteobacteria bacterium]
MSEIFKMKNPKVEDYKEYIKKKLGEEVTPMYEIRQEDLIYLLAWTAKGYQVFWFDANFSFVREDFVYKEIHHIKKEEEAIDWFIGHFVCKGLRRKDQPAIKKITCLNYGRDEKENVILYEKK